MKVRDIIKRIEHMTYAIIIENAGNNYSAYVPDLPGCITTGPTIEETKRNMQEAIALYCIAAACERMGSLFPSQVLRQL